MGELARPDPDRPWPGRWVAEALGLRVDAEPGPCAVHDLVGLALRRNPRRAHLPVSLVLGKHLAADPRTVRAAGHLLGEHVGRRLGGEAPAVVLGYAENATGLGALVADALDAEHLVTTTRRVVPGAATALAFHEPHSHAGRHLLTPDEPARWAPELPLVLVDDEVSTGTTAAASLRLVHRAWPRRRYVLATLVDLRDPTDDAVERAAAELGVHVETVALARGRLRAPADVLARAAELVASRPATGPTSGAAHAPAQRVRLELDGAPTGARHGVDRAARARMEAALPAAIAALAAAIGARPGPTLVLGTEELHYLPVRLAEGLADAGFDVRVATTTRSPIVPVDAPGYPVRSALTFPAHDTALGGAGDRYLYALDDAPARTVVLVVDDDADGPALHRPNGLVAQIAGRVERLVEVVVPAPRPRPPRGVPVRRGPAFGTFAPDEVSWLLTDLSAHALEVDLARREREVAAGRHYSETLPPERAPAAEYDQLFRRALHRSADRVAALVGHVTDLVLATRGPRPVLVSLARAGTPIGALMRRWARRVRGVDLPHYAISVVRGRGVDRVALTALVGRHDPASLVFVDGWTGKGTIVDELATGLAGAGPRLDPTVVALADPAHGTTLHGTREDVLIPSACLTATVCGLVSRTVRRPDLHGHDAYDGAQFYPGLAAADRTATFLDTVADRFPDVAPEPGDVALPRDAPDRRGTAYVAALARRLGVVDEHLVKPGIGETTRVLLRRAPAMVLLAPDAGADVEHIRMLCRDRGVPIAELPARAGGIDSPYRSVGVIRGARA